MDISFASTFQGMEKLFGSVALWGMNFGGLSRCFMLTPVRLEWLQIRAFDFRDPFEKWNGGHVE